MDQADQAALTAKVAQAGAFQFAACAWGGFQALQKRGALIVSLETETTESGEAGYATHGAYYCPLGADIFKLIKPEDAAAIRLALAHYDPETEFVLIVSFAKLGNTGLAPWLTCKPPIPPPAAFAEANARPDEFNHLFA